MSRAVLGLATLVVGIALLAFVVGAFADSRCATDDEAGAGHPVAAIDAVTGEPRTGVVPKARKSKERRARPAAPPVGLEIPDIGVRARIIRLGLNPDRSLEVPQDFAETGWWSGGPRPGDRGPAVIVGHVDSKTGPAVFYRIRELGPGDEIAVVRADGSRARFVVQGSEQYPKADFPTVRVYGRTPGPTLRLITCSGTFDRSTGHYLSNTVVYARAA
jgi:hypothetical protein